MLLAVSLVAIVGVVALGMDGGRMMEERRRAQAAADAAALAAAKQGYDLLHQSPSRVPSPTYIVQAATQSLANNGYVNDGLMTSVTAQVGPSGGLFKGDPNSVEVVVQSTVKATFGRIFTQTDPVVRARAVARFKRRQMGLVVLEPSAAKALQVLDNASVTVKNDSIYVNSSSSSAVYVASGASLVGDTLNVVGNILGGVLSLLGALLGGVNTGTTPVPDPFADLPPPNPANYPTNSSSTLWISASTTLQPGVYQGGIQISGGTVTLSPGVYILQGGGLQVSGTAVIVAAGVFIYNTGGVACGPITVTGQASLTMSPPTSGPYAGICIFQDRLCTPAIQLVGSGGITVTGVIYAANAPVQVAGNATGTQLGCVTCRTLVANGNGTIQLTTNPDPPLSYQIRLVE